MEALLCQFSFLANQACHDKSFDPAKIEELMGLFEYEAYESWSAMDTTLNKTVEESEIAMKEADEYLNLLMLNSMEDFEAFHSEIEKSSKAELESLVHAAKNVNKVGDAIGTVVTTASKKYMDAALSSATGSMKSAWKGFSSNPSKVHPS
eukprot:TRINITY_DN16482_c0_g1_i1.p1 TRINITY_DN16482_c0_g1~~TRINITY_DN16482_c0_g1_i1.p1  ORF type:complete len:150 (-),score=30.29 TRINITY_DN16482_c0_g1_i1:135-584(-)